MGFGMKMPALIAMLLLVAGCGPLGQGTMFVHDDNALGPYSGSVLAGDFCFVSGKIGDVTGSFAEELSSAIAAVEQELARAGLTLEHVVQVTVYVTDIDFYTALNNVYASRFVDPYPARVVVAVSALPGGARVQVQAIARRQ
jgi:2-iminobutanoate/2-iminopropanoate deaminase